jgi:hypothetical protein
MLIFRVELYANLYVLITYRAYVLSFHFQAQGFTAEDFDVMCGIASWATSGPSHSREKPMHEEYDGDHGHGQG